eukprot:6397859-Amphidinium_carterae.1
MPVVAAKTIEHMPRAIPVPPPPQRSGAPSTSTNRYTNALADVTPPVSRRALSVASPSSKYSSPAASPDSAQSFAYVRPVPSPPNVLRNMPPPPPLKRVPPPPAPLKNGESCGELVNLLDSAPCRCWLAHVHVGALDRLSISFVCDSCVAAFELVRAVAPSLAKMASLPRVRLEIWRANPSNFPRLNLARIIREREQYGALD